jgi:hypothetical protein
MHCKRVVFSALDHFDDLGPETQRLISDAQGLVVLLTGNELFDQYPEKHFSVEHPDSSDLTATEAYISRVKSFLEWRKQNELGERL